MTARHRTRPPAMVAHDLRNLLTVIAAQTDRMARALPPEPELLRASAAVQEAIRRASELTSSLAGPPGNSPTSPAGRRPTPRGSGRALLAEGDLQVRQVVAAMLAGLGFEVEQCASASATRESLELASNPTRLVVLDLSLPDLDPTALLGRLRRSRPELPVLLLKGTLNAAIDSLLDARTAALDKPFRAAELASVVARLAPGRETPS